MKINSSIYQAIVIFTSILLLLIMYFGCERKSPEIRDLEKSRKGQLEATGIQNIIMDANSLISNEQKLIIEELNNKINDEMSDIEKAEIYKRISSEWYNFGFPAIAGYYAEEVAKILNDEQSWSIAGTTYAIGINKSEDKKIKAFCQRRAVKAFENAISINPDNVSHRINIAVCYTDFPPSDNPMKGILMLRELNEQFPENVNVLNQLARLAIKTNQFDKARERLQQALAIDPTNKTSNCMMADLLSALNEDNTLFVKYCSY